MNATEFQDLLDDLSACAEAVKWARDKDLHTVWTTCERGDWLLWLCGKMVDKPGWPTRVQLVLAACSCAETSLKYVPLGEDRPRVAIETARKWVYGKATIEEVRQAASSATNAAYATNPTRFHNRKPEPPKLPTIAWINEPVTEEEVLQKAA